MATLADRWCAKFGSLVRRYEADDNGRDVCGAFTQCAQAQLLLPRQAQQKRVEAEAAWKLRLATMLAWAKVLHERLGAESAVPSDLDMFIVERINDHLVHIKLPSETFSDFYAFRGKWSGRLPRSRSDGQGRLITGGWRGPPPSPRLHPENREASDQAGDIVIS
jgi:hypothetical protein